MADYHSMLLPILGLGSYPPQKDNIVDLLSYIELIVNWIKFVLLFCLEIGDDGLGCDGVGGNAANQ